MRMGKSDKSAMGKTVLSQVFRDRLAEIGLGPVEAVAPVEGLEKNFIRDIVEERKFSFRQANVPLVAQAMRWTVAELNAAIQGEDPPPKRVERRKLQWAPLLDNVQAGKLASPMSQIPADQARKIAVSGISGAEIFALKVEGTSMDKVSPEGSIIIVDRSDRALIKGKFYVFYVMGDTTYKRWQADPDYLEPYTNDTDQHKPLYISKKRDMEVIGRVKRTILDL